MASTALLRLSKPLLLPLSIVGAGGFYGAWDLSQKAASTLLSFDASKQRDVHSFLGTAGATALSCTAVALRSRFDPPPLPPAAQAAPPGGASSKAGAAGAMADSVKHALRTMMRQATAFPYRYYVVSVFGGAVVLGVSQRAFQKCLHMASPPAAPASSDASA